MCRTRHGRLFLFLMLLFTRAAAGEAGTVQVLPGDSPVVIRGTIGNDNSFVKRIALIAAAGVPELIFRSTDLQGVGGTQQISRQQIVPTSTTKFDLPKNTPKDFEFKVTGTKTPGTYEGKLYFLRPEQGPKPALEVPIKVIAEGVPKLSQRKGSESLKIQLVNCRVLGCGLARWLQPSAFPSSYPLQFDNGSLEPFDMVTTVTAIGDTTHSSLEQVLRVQSPVKVPSAPVYTLPIAIQDVKLSPDHYVGDVQIRLPGQDAPLKIPLEVNVRAGPILPLVVLLVGILLGRLLKYMKDKGGPQSDLLLNVYHLENRIALSPADQLILQPMLEDVKTRIYDMQLDVAKTQLAATKSRWTLLNTLRSLEQTLQPRAADPGVQQVLNDIQTARNLVAARQDQQASTLVAQIEAAVRNLIAPHPPAVQAFALASAQARTARVLAVRGVHGAAPPPLPPYVRTLSFLTGISGTLRAEVTLWVIRPLIYLLLIGGLLILGLQQLYLKNMTFGSDSLSDYFGILIWAMSSDVASRTLSTLKSGPA